MREEQQKLIDALLNDPDWALYLKELRLAGYGVDFRVTVEEDRRGSRFLGVSMGTWDPFGANNYIAIALGRGARYEIWGETSKHFDIVCNTLEETLEQLSEKVREL